MSSKLKKKRDVTLHRYGVKKKVLNHLIDLTLNMREKIYLFEFKMAHHNESPKTKKYYEKYIELGKPIYLVGMIFDLAVKNLTVFEHEPLSTN